MFEGDPGNTMYEFLNGLRYTYYCSEENGCDSTYWNSLDTSDAIPNPDLYIFINDTLTLYGGSGDFVEFGCDGNVILSVEEKIDLKNYIGKFVEANISFADEYDLYGETIKIL